MRRQVILHGDMAGFCDTPIFVEASTAAQVVEAVTRQLKGFAPDPIRGHRRIKVVGFDDYDSLYQDLGDQEVLHFVPQLNGGKAGGFLQILLGVALVAIGFFTFGATSWIGSMLMKVGALAALGGIASMLAPQPETDGGTTNSSGYLGAPKNTTQIGTRIPILYGKRKVYGHVLSFDVNAMEYKIKPDQD